MCRRFFQGLQQRVKGLRRQHVHFIDDIDFVFSQQRRIRHLLDDLSDIVDAVVAGGVKFDDVRMISLQICQTVLAGIAGLFLKILAVDRFRKELCDRSLTGSSWSGKKIRMGDPVLFDRIQKRFYDVLLSDDLREFRRSVCPVQYLICHNNIIAHITMDLRLKSISRVLFALVFEEFF